LAKFKSSIKNQQPVSSYTGCWFVLSSVSLSDIFISGTEILTTESLKEFDHLWQTLSVGMTLSR